MKERWSWTGVLSILIVMYGAVLFLTGVCLLKQMRQVGHTWQRTFYLFLSLGTLGRIVYFGVVSATIWGGKVPTPVLFAINTLSPFLFFSAFLIILYLLMEVLSGRVQHAKQFVTLNVVMYVGYAGAMVANMAVSPFDKYNEKQDNNTIQTCVIFASASMYIVTAAFFAVYGARLRSVLSKLALNKTRTALVFKITSIASVVTGFFVVRSIVVVVALFRTGINFDWYVFGLYYAVLEVTPVSLMLYILRRHTLGDSSSSCPPGTGEGDTRGLFVNQRDKHAAYLSLAHTAPNAPPPSPYMSYAPLPRRPVRP